MSLIDIELSVPNVSQGRHRCGLPVNSVNADFLSFARGLAATSRCAMFPRVVAEEFSDELESTQEDFPHNVPP